MSSSEAPMPHVSGQQMRRIRRENRAIAASLGLLTPLAMAGILFPRARAAKAHSRRPPIYSPPRRGR